MRSFVLGWVAGAWLLQRQATLPDELLAAGVALAAVGAACFVHHRSACRVNPFAYAVAGLACGFAWAALLAHHRLDDRLSPALERRDVVVTGVVAGLPQPVERGVRFAFDVERAPAGVPRRILLGWYNGLSPEEFRALAPLRAGERWRFTVRLGPPRGLANPHGFDYEAWLLERGIRATGYVRPAGAERLDGLALRPAYLLERLRERIRERFWDALPAGHYAGILVALAIGDQNAIGTQQWRVFARTGVSHLMSISGLHVTMISGLFAWFASASWRRGGSLALRCPAQRAAAVAGFLAALLYCLVSGFAIPAQRTLYMIGVVAAALWLDRAGSPSRVLALALFVVLLADPWAVLAPGFWLSFAAVAVIFYVGTAPRETAGRARQWVSVQGAVTVALAPLLLVLFQQVSLVAPLANAVAIPLVSLAVTPLALAAAVLPFDAPLLAGHALLGWMMPFLERLANVEGAVWQQHAPAGWTVALAFVGTAWLLAPRGVPARALGLALFVPLFAVKPPPPREGEVRLTVLDVGQGTAVVARTHRHVLLYDAGPSWGTQSDAGVRVVLPYLRGEGVAQLDALVISHEDGDHAGGAHSVFDALAVGRLHSSLPQDHSLQSRAPYRVPCHAGFSWIWDGVLFEMLHPDESRHANPWSSANDRSCVLRITTQGRTVLLTGDIGSGAEHALLERHGDALKSDVLLVPHHGSRRSSSPAFVAKASPRYAVISVGRGNRFGHPGSEVMARYEAAGSTVVRTDEAGAVTFHVGRNVSVATHRTEAQRYWRR